MAKVKEREGSEPRRQHRVPLLPQERPPSRRLPQKDRRREEEPQRRTEGQEVRSKREGQGEEKDRGSGSKGTREVTPSRRSHRHRIDNLDTADTGQPQQRGQRSDAASAAARSERVASEDDSGAEGRGLKVRDHKIDWKWCLPDTYYGYDCNSCKKYFEGWRWHFAEWQLDMCPRCAKICLDDFDPRKKAKKSKKDQRVKEEVHYQ